MKAGGIYLRPAFSFLKPRHGKQRLYCPSMLQPLPPAKWNSICARHLLSRAGFGGSPSEIEKLTGWGIDRAVEQFVDFEKISDPTPAPEWAKPDPNRLERLQKFRRASAQERREMQREERRRQVGNLQDLRHEWLRRMTEGPRPLQEKLVLFWHGHFATSIQKVKDAYLMWRQNEIFRRYAAASWGELLAAVSKDPAMLVWLDQAQSRKEHPNENFAREVMELFTLGEGNYTEKDVTEAARAFTGWSFDRARQEFVNRPMWHDRGDKTVLGKTGDLDGDAALRQILAQPQAARFITTKLWTFFAAENPSADLIDSLAEEFRRSGYQFRPWLRQIFRSEQFYAPSIMGAQVKSPVQWLVQSVRELERRTPPPMITNNVTRLLGQELFAPPNVKGWDGGLSWITTNNLINRYHLAELLVLGVNPMPMANDRPALRARMANFRRGRKVLDPIDVEKLFAPDERENVSKLMAALQRRFLPAALKPNQIQVLREYLEKAGGLSEETIRQAVRLIMSTPEYQLT